MRLRGTAALFLLGLLACSSEGSGDPDTGNGDTTSEAGESSSSDSESTEADTSSSESGDAGDGDAGEAGDGDSATTGDGDGGGEVSCDGLQPGEAFEIATDEGTTRIHAFVAADDNGAWFTFAKPESGGTNFEVSLMHINCEGEVDVAPQIVNTDAGNHIDPSVAISDDRLLIVWNTDSGTAPDNLQIHARRYDLTGAALDTEQFRVATSFDGSPVTGNHSSPSVSPSDEGFAVAGLRAHPQSQSFVAFDQTVGLDGTLSGEPIDPPIEADTSDQQPASSQGYLTYARNGSNGSQVWLVNPQEVTTPVFEGATATQPQIVPHVDGPILAGTAGADDTNIAVALSTFSPILIGEADAAERDPAIAAAPDGSLGLLFHRDLGGGNNAVIFQRLDVDNGTLVTVGAEQQLDTMSPPYPLSLSWSQSGWIATWSRGESPNFTTWAQVLAFE